jgi:hypothetical protein
MTKEQLKEFVHTLAVRMGEAMRQELISAARRVCTDMPEGPEKEEMIKKLTASHPIHIN